MRELRGQGCPVNTRMSVPGTTSPVAACSARVVWTSVPLAETTEQTEMTMQPAEQRASLPTLVYVIAAGIFLMGTTEFLLAGTLPEVAADLGGDTTRAGLLITAFAVGMIIGPPIMALATLR